VTLGARAIRPLPPGNLQADGVSVVNPNVLNQGPVTLTWAHRDRLAQTSSVFDAYSLLSGEQRSPTSPRSQLRSKTRAPRGRTWSSGISWWSEPVMNDSS